MLRYLLNQEEEVKNVTISENFHFGDIYKTIRMSSCTFESRELQGIIGVSFIGCTFSEVQSFEEMRSCTFKDCTFFECVIQANVNLSYMERCTFKGCCIELMEFYKTPLKQVSFVDCYMDRVQIDKTVPCDIKFKKTKKKGVSFFETT